MSTFRSRGRNLWHSDGRPAGWGMPFAAEGRGDLRALALGLKLGLGAVALIAAPRLAAAAAALLP